MGDEGFDDQFDDGLFHATLHGSRRERPDQWPRSVSEMRGHTAHDQKSTSNGALSDIAHSDQMTHRQAKQQSRRDGFRYGHTYGPAGAIHEGMAGGYRQFFDSGSGMWVVLNRSGHIVAKETMRIRQFFDSARGRWVSIDPSGLEIVRQQ